MATPVEIEEKIENESQRLDQWFDKFQKCSTILLIIIFILLLLFYIWKCSIFDIKESINAERWGQFGDFFGGVVGSFITYISILFLYKAFKEQRLANVETKETNKELLSQNKKLAEYETQHLYQEQLQQFENKFNRLFFLYQHALSFYNNSSAQKNDKIYLCDKIESHLSNISFSPPKNYRKRVEEASKTFNTFIHTYNSQFSTHMHLLYQILCLLESDVIKEEDRVLYAKAFRAQLTDKELILIRYNCLNEKGEKMRLPVFHYNILKHLPLLNLLEFNEYKKFLTPQEINILNEELINWRKQICNIFRRDNYGEQKSFERNYLNYTLSISVNNTNQHYTFTLNKNRSSIPGDTHSYPIINILNRFSNGLLEALLLDFNMEILNYSYFRIYNKQNRISHRHYTDGDRIVFSIIVKNTQPIIVSYFQIKDPLPTA